MTNGILPGFSAFASILEGLGLRAYGNGILPGFSACFLCLLEGLGLVGLMGFRVYGVQCLEGLGFIGVRVQGLGATTGAEFRVYMASIRFR